MGHLRALVIKINPRGLLTAAFTLTSLALIAYWIGGAIAGWAPQTAKEEIPIGANLELSGIGAPFGQAVANGAQLAIGEINSQGGLLDGRPLKLFLVDNQSDPGATVKGLERLGEGVRAVLGPATTANALAAAEAMASGPLPLVTPSATAAAVTVNPKTQEVWSHVFRACYVDPWQGKAMAQFAYKDLGARRAAVLWEKGASYSVSLAKAFGEAFQALEGKVVLSQSYERGEEDFQAFLEEAIKLGAQAIYMPGYYPEGANLMRQAREGGVEIPLLGGDGWDSPRLVELAGNANVREVYYTNHFSPEDPSPRVRGFVAAYKAKYKENPDSLAALGYDSVLLLAEAIRLAGSDQPEAIKGALAQCQITGVTGSFQLDGNHNPRKGMVILEMSQGQPKLRDKIEAGEIH